MDSGGESSSTDDSSSKRSNISTSRSESAQSCPADSPPGVIVMMAVDAFEGSEKRLELDCRVSAQTPAAGLRSLTRQQLDALLAEASCTIVSSLSNDVCDSYVLSESSLFVQRTKLVLKTCGTTKLLAALPTIVDLVHGLGMELVHLRFSRASFLFPQCQPSPHHCFKSEADFLHATLQDLGLEGSHSVLGDVGSGLQWHLFVASLPQLPDTGLTGTTLEVCMTKLCPVKARAFCRGPDFRSAKDTTADTGVQGLLPAAAIDDFVFEPCGYSMNALEGPLMSSIHVTPEEGWSYASFELCGPSLPDLLTTVQQVAGIFCPGSMTVTVSGSHPETSLPEAAAWDALGSSYALIGTASHQPRLVGTTLFLSFDRVADLPPPVLTPEAAAAEQLQDTDPSISAATAMAAHAPPQPEQHPGSTPAAQHGQQAAQAQALAQSPGKDGSTSVLGSFEAADRLSDDCPSSASTTPRSSFGPSRPESPFPQPGLLRPEHTVYPAGQPAAACKVPSGPASQKDVLAKHQVQYLDQGGQAAVHAHLADLIQARGYEDPVYVIDLGCAARLMGVWKAALPRVQPCYAVKCNDDQALLELLASMGAGFDCASEQELATVVGMGVAPSRIVYANPCKRPRDVRTAAKLGVDLTTFDTVCELEKLAEWHPSTAVLLRIRADDPAARCPLGHKYGAEEPVIESLLQAAKRLGIALRGVSFHVGSGATNPHAFSDAIAAAKRVFSRGLALGFNMDLLDIGGGFCHQENGESSFASVAVAVNQGLAKHFPDADAVRVIAEPGRFFAESAATLGCMVFGERSRPHGQGQDYWITDGLYGSFNCLLYDHATLAPAPLLQAQISGRCPAGLAHSLKGPLAPSTVFGPTCDGADQILQAYPLPQLRRGDWLVFPNMGAYTLVGACKFNGIDVVDVAKAYVWSSKP